MLCDNWKFVEKYGDLCCNLCECKKCINVYKKTEENIKEFEEKIDIEKYGFEYLDNDVYRGKYEIKIEYVGDDMEYKEEEDFDNYNEWRIFRNKYFIY
jgi:hypothetical protein